MKREVFRETLEISSNGFVEITGGHAIKAGKVGIQHHSLTPNKVDACLDLGNGQ